MIKLNIKSKNNKFKENNNNSKSSNLENVSLLPYYFKSNSTSEDPSFPLHNLEERNISNGGWISEKNCVYPQKIIAKFDKYVNIREIYLIINETKIPKIIQFINCIEQEESSLNTKNKYKYENIGFIELSPNVETNYKSREFRKIILNVNNTNRIKILIHENYQNSFNTYNQVGIVSLEFYGNINNINNNASKIINYDNDKNKEENGNENNNNNEEENKIIKNNENMDKNNKIIKKKKKIKLVDINKKPRLKSTDVNNINIINDIKDQNDNSDKSNNNINDNKINDDNLNNNINNNENNYINISNTIKTRNLNRSKSNISNNLNKIIKAAHINYSGKSVKKENKENELNIIDDKMKKIKQLIEENEKEKYNKENKEFRILQNQIDELKSLINNIYEQKEQEQKIITNRQIIENYKSQKDNDNYKIKTINNNNLFKLNGNKEIQLSLKKNYSINNQKNNITRNLNNDKLLYKKLKIIQKKKDVPHLESLSYDNFPLLKIKKRELNNDKEISKSEEENNKNDSLYESNGNNIIEDNSSEGLSFDTKEKNESLILLIGDDIIKKIFSKNIPLQEEGFNSLNDKIYDIIINKSGNLKETNNYIILLINIIVNFLDDKHPIIVMKSLELFIIILKAIEDKSNINQIEYDFIIAKHIIIKIKEKLNHTSRRIRKKAEELYCCMLNSKFCDFYTLISELISDETYEYNYKINIINNGNYNLNINNGIENNINSKLKLFFNKNLIITKMNILLSIFTNCEEKIRNFNIKKFPKKPVGDYLIMNISNPKEEVREITKKVLVKYIKIFGNEIFYKLKLVIGNKQFTKIIQDNKQLIEEMIKYENERNQKIKEAKILLNNLKIYNKSNHLIIGINNNTMNINNHYSHYININNLNQNRYLIKTPSQPKLPIINKKNLMNFNKISFSPDNTFSSPKNESFINKNIFSSDESKN